MICGQVICTYEHIDPPWVDAKEHDASKMALLCYQCHGKVTKGLVSKNAVWTAKGSPAAKKQEYAREIFAYEGEHLAIQFGPITVHNCLVAIAVARVPIVWVDPPKEEGEPWLFNARFWNADGKETFSIEDNVWTVNAENWDVQTTGNNIVIRNGRGDIALDMDWVNGGLMHVKSVDMFVFDYRIRCNEEIVEVTWPDGVKSTMGAMELYASPCALQIC